MRAVSGVRLIALLAALFLYAGVLGGCENSDSHKTSGETKNAPSAAQSAGKLFYRNPLVKNFADPSVILASDGKYYAYPTGGNKFKVYSSTDLIHWRDEGVALSSSDVAWAKTNFWAPEVLERNGKYYMYFSAGADVMHISVAVSDKPTGPFNEVLDQPLLNFEYSTIDPYVFIDDDGKIYMYYSKNMAPVENRKESHIYVVELGEDMMSLKGEPVLVSKPEQPWELKSGNKRWNEGSFVLKKDGTYYLMYSANCYCGRSYSVGYSTSKSPFGPFTKYRNNPVLSAEYSKVSGTGHHSIVRSPDGRELFIVYHSHINPAEGGGNRQLNIDRMGFREDGSIYVNGPTLSQQPPPSGVNGLTNIAREAKITAGSVKEGFSVKALQDGEIGIYPTRTETKDWVVVREAGKAWVKLEWDQAREVDSIWIYNSARYQRALQTGTVVMSDGTKEHVEFPKGEPGAAAIVRPSGKKLKWIRFEVGETLVSGSDAGLSEIFVLGK
jgi:GH43 family beta-xylosidase